MLCDPGSHALHPAAAMQGPMSHLSRRPVSCPRKRGDIHPLVTQRHSPTLFPTQTRVKRCGGQCGDFCKYGLVPILRRLRFPKHCLTADVGLTWRVFGTSLALGLRSSAVGISCVWDHIFCVWAYISCVWDHIFCAWGSHRLCLVLIACDDAGLAVALSLLLCFQCLLFLGV